MARLSRFVPVFLFLALAAAGAAPAAAQTTMTEIEALSFGLFSLRDNDAPHELTVYASDGSFTAAQAFAVATPAPQRGEYLLEGFNPGEEIVVTIEPGGLAFGGAGADIFTVTNYTVEPSPVIAGAGGSVTIYVGATLRTSGNGVVGDTGAYSGELDITFDWVP